MSRRRVLEVRRNLSAGTQLVDTYDSAKATREVFQGYPQKKVQEHAFGWPRFVQYIGRTNAENYFSNKSLSGGKWEFYKHIAEGPQFLFINPEITVLVNDRNEPVELREAGRRVRANLSSGSVPVAFSGRSYEITGPMPAHLADLAPSKGIQWVDPSSKYFEARIPHSTLAAAKHPVTGETILVVYTAEGIHFMVTGPKLGVTRDGIVG